MIDNASDAMLSNNWDLSWHPEGRHLRVDELGLTPARLAGISNTKGDLLIFVDDDNVVAPNYLEMAMRIARDYPWIGAFNGSTIGEFEVEPPDWARSLVPQLAVREIQSVVWACGPGIQAVSYAPCGAGMVVRRTVAEDYRRRAVSDPLRRDLDRSGSVLASAGDTDMALCACALGLGVGLFPDLVLKHLIPPRRLEREYLIRLAEGMSRSHAILGFIWEKRLPQLPQIPCRSERILKYYQKWRAKRRGTFESQFIDEINEAFLRGQIEAREALEARINGNI